ncbi:MAG: ribonuclease J [Rickettsiaceae bacterium]
MSFNIKHFTEELLFVPLGGANEIGMNFNLYHYKGKWIIIDCGVGFADEYAPGVDMVIADMSFVAQHKENIIGIIVTHAHEDHVGAIPYLLKVLNCPVYTTEFTSNFLRYKLHEHKISDTAQINVIKPDSNIKLEPFNIDLISLNHSTVEMQALMIRTEKGNILHTGDWKFDQDPVIGETANKQALEALGKDGVLALVCDSTNVLTNKPSGSEGALRENLVNIVKQCKKLVVITTFASNIARIDSIIHAAKESGRKVALLGRSLNRILATAQDSGYMMDVNEHIIHENDIKEYKREELLVIATGCQGEAMAALSRMSYYEHPKITICKNDTIIFSSKMIPGNEKKILRLINVFIRSKVNIITSNDSNFVHVSGHPSAPELDIMYDLIKPKISVPVHGEPIHLQAHIELAKKNGVDHAINVENGSVVLLNEKSPRIVGKVQSGYFGIDGQALLPLSSNIFKMRRHLNDSGIIIVSIVLDKRCCIITKPIISAPGSLDPKTDEQFINLIRAKLMKSLVEQRTKIKGNVTNDQIAEIVRTTIRKTIKQSIGKKPKIIVNVEHTIE